MSGQAYTPALQVTKQTRVRKTRELPLAGKVLVSKGEKVSADTAVLSAELPGDLTIIRVASRMGFDAPDVLAGMKVKVGDTIVKGDLLCEVTSFFGLFTSRLESPADGTIEFFTESNAHLGVRHQSTPLSVNAYIDGVVVELEEGKSVTVETEAALIQGIFGVGGERHGEIVVLGVEADRTVDVEDLSKEEELSGKILIGGSQYTLSALQLAAEKNVSAVVCGSIDASTLYQYVGYEIGVAITGDEDVPCTLILTEGFGQLSISERVVKLASSLSGKSASVNGATQVRAGATRPEIIVPNQNITASADVGLMQESKPLEVGARLRVIRVPYFGQFGTITELPHEPQGIPSGATVRVLRAKLDSGEDVSVPRANVELI